MAPRSKVAPIAAQRFELRLTVGQSMHDKLRYAQALLGHQVPSGDVAEVLERGLDSLIRDLEKRKLAATGTPRVADADSMNLYQKLRYAFGNWKIEQANMVGTAMPPFESGVTVRYTDAQQSNRVLNGFAVITLSGDSILEEFVDQTGGVNWSNRPQD